MKKLIYNKFDKPTIATLKRVVFNGKIVVVSTPAQAESAVDYLLAQPVLGLDTGCKSRISRFASCSA